MLDKMNRLVAELETVIETVRTGRRDHIGARTDLELITGELMQDMKLLDGIIRYRSGIAPEWIPR